jgi:hypothetical protein
MELSTTRKITSCVVIRWFPSISWNPKVQYRIHNSSLTCPYAERYQSSPHHSIISFQRSILILSKNLRLPIGLFPSNNLHAVLLLCATFPAYFIHLDLVILIILGKEYKSQNSSLCSYKQLFCHSLTSTLFPRRKQILWGTHCSVVG